ncbi:MAG: 3'(2'),5'-bisphosphate nucleotidase CysQ [Oscillospiraceae bacterium]|nr:3'(2'),5'-bisphosphate nucleotidase CysQ [Oscillospiraceae bacterium]
MNNIVWHNNKVDEITRINKLNQRGLVLWFTGLSGAGKSTIAVEVEAELTRLGFVAYILDGDNLRHGINSNLGFSKDDRDENIRRIYEIANLFCNAQIITLVSAISPYEKMRCEAREKIVGRDDLGAPADVSLFCEIYIKASVETCKSRDPKELYKKEIIGADTIYEAPENPDIIIDTEKLSVEESVKIIVQYILEKQIDYLLPKILEIAIYAAYDAGKIILDVYKKDFDVKYKDDKSPLTEADKKSNGLICGQLKKYSPYIDILAEESVDDKKRLSNKFCFIVDPLDGTKEFIKKNGEFTVNIGLSYNNKSVMGIIYAPCLNKFWYAVRNRGAYALDLNKNILKLFDGNTKIKVSERTQDLIVMKSRSHSDERTEALLEKNKNKIKIITDRGSSLKGCMIAEGLADIYYRFGYTMEWDTCAMQCIIEEAGGIFVQGDWTEMTYNRENSLNEKGFIILNRIENKLD